MPKLRFKYTKELSSAMANMLTAGSTQLLDQLEDQARPLAEGKFLETAADPDMPPDIATLLKANVGAPGGIHLAAIIPYLVGGAFGLMLGMAFPISRWGAMPIERLLKTARLDPGMVTRLWLRGYPSEDKKDKWFDDLSDQGFSEDRKDAIKELAHYMPSPIEVMTWAAREVFEPELREKFQLDLGRPIEYENWAAKVGITDEVMKNFWASHWALPGLTSIVELWRREELSDEEVADFWTELDMVPWIRDKLFKLFREVPTRVDVRRWWDMRTVDEPRLRRIYKAMGYWEEDLEDYVTWTKVYTAFPDLLARYKNGWITLQTVYDELIAMNMSPERATELLETKIKNVAAVERVAKERDLTKSEIIKGVKKNVITVDQGIELLEEMNYDTWEAEFIIAINIEAAGSPETPFEIKRLVDKYKRSQGMEVKEIPEDLMQAERKWIEADRKLKEATAREAPQDELDELAVVVAEAAVMLREVARLHEIKPLTD